MQPKFIFITFGVENLEKSVAFYKDGLGWQTDGIVAQELHDEKTGADGTIAFFKFENGIMLGLYEKSNFSKDAHVSNNHPNPTEFSLGYPAKSKEEVNSVLKLAEAAGAEITALPHIRPWGIYSGYFKDPDGHLWEIVFELPKS